MKYPHKHGKDRTPVNQEDAIKSMHEFIKVVKKHKPEAKEKSFHLYLENDCWTTYADSMQHKATGKHIQEFIL